MDKLHRVAIALILLLPGLSFGAVGFTFSDTAFVGNANRTTAAAFSPDSIASLVRWHKPEALVFNVGDAVNVWSNSTSATTRNLTNNVVGSRPYYTNQVGQINNYAWVQNDSFKYLFNGTDDYAQPNTIFLVMWIKGMTDSGSFLDATNSTLSRAYVADRDKLNLNAGNAIGGASRSLDSNTWYLVELVVNGASSAIRTNGVTYVTGDAGGNRMGGITLFNRYDQAQLQKCGIAEVAMFNAVLSAGDTTSMRTYFKSKYLLW